MNTICFGQQPCGFFPKRFLVAKIETARKLQKELGLSRQGGAKADGKIVFFYHDSDADYRETITIFKDRQTNAEVRLNFTQENKLQKKFSPLYLKRIPTGWKEETLKQLPRFIDPEMINLFSSVEAKTAGDFCLEMYKKLGLLDGIEIFRSSDANFRQQALELDKDYFADVEYEGEIVRARIESPATPTIPSRSAVHPSLAGGEAPRSSPPFQGGVPPLGGEVVGVLHEGGDKYIRFPIPSPLNKSQINPSRDNRFAWMQSVIHCTHYIAGNAEYDYIKKEDFPEVKFIKRDQTDNQDYAWLPS